MPEKYLILISIGPVQEFIASARKLRDLWFGSDLLAALSRTVARTLAENGAELVFPAPLKPEEIAADAETPIANKILAEYAGNDPSVLIGRARESWRSHLAEVARQTREVVGKNFARLRLREDVFEKQVADCGEFFGVWQTVGADGYAAARAGVEALLAARKGVRAFAPPSWDGAGLPKNSLDGIRECVTETDVEFPGLLKKSERLDAMGCIKRFSPLAEKGKVRHFDDLASCALVPWREAIKARGLADEEAGFIAALGGSPENARAGQRFAEDWYADAAILRRDYGEAAKDAIACRKRIVGKVGLPPPYACILVGDGDRMGLALDAIKSAAGHRVFSRGLAVFAVEAKTVIASFGGSLVYAGGDDVMAYVPLDRAVVCADAVRRVFAAAMDAIFAAPELKDLAGAVARPTFSAGLAMVHHQMPLGAALGLARKAERMAKDKGGRDALAFIMSKRSGSDIAVCGKWEDGPDGKGLVSRLESLSMMYAGKDIELPHTLGYQLREVVRQCGDRIDCRRADGKVSAGNAATAMLLDIFKQKKDAAALGELLAGRKSIRGLADELVIARHIHEVRKLNDGGGQ